MADNFDDAMNSVKNMINSGNIPPEIQEMMKNMGIDSSQLSNAANSTNKSSNNTSDQQNNQSSSSNSSFNIDMQTMLKMKNIFDSMNRGNDPRANLLNSLKPYMRNTKKEKIDQYVNMFNMAKVADLMKNDKKEPKNDT